MNKKQIFVLWVLIITIAILIGLKTTTVYEITEIYKPNGPENGHTALMLYGMLVLMSENAGKLYPLLNLGDYKYNLIVVTVMIGLALLYTIKSK